MIEYVVFINNVIVKEEFNYNSLLSTFLFILFCTKFSL